MNHSQSILKHRSSQFQMDLLNQPRLFKFDMIMHAFSPIKSNKTSISPNIHQHPFGPLALNQTWTKRQFRPVHRGPKPWYVEGNFPREALPPRQRPRTVALDLETSSSPRRWLYLWPELIATISSKIINIVDLSSYYS